MNIPGSTQGRICCLLAVEADNTNEEIFKRNIWTLAMCFIYFTYNVYFSRKIKKYLLGQCPNMRLSCIGKYPRNAMSYKVCICPTPVLPISCQGAPWHHALVEHLHSA